MNGTAKYTDCDDKVTKWDSKVCHWNGAAKYTNWDDRIHQMGQLRIPIEWRESFRMGQSIPNGTTVCINRHDRVHWKGQSILNGTPKWVTEWHRKVYQLERQSSPNGMVKYEKKKGGKKMIKYAKQTVSKGKTNSNNKFDKRNGPIWYT